MECTASKNAYYLCRQQQHRVSFWRVRANVGALNCNVTEVVVTTQAAAAWNPFEGGSPPSGARPAANAIGHSMSREPLPPTPFPSPRGAQRRQYRVQHSVMPALSVGALASVQQI